MLGLASGLHCAGMCGGIVAAFSARRLIPIVPAGRAAPEWRRQLAFNAGRISTYALAGAAAGALGGAAHILSGALPAQTALYVLANAMLLLLGLHLAGAGRLLGRLEGLGAPLWRRVQPAAARLLGSQAPLAAYGAGTLPWLLAAGAAASRLLAWARRARLRVFAGALVLGMGVVGLARSAEVGAAVRAGLLCLS